jgi:Tol biopolymer transport system component
VLIILEANKPLMVYSKYLKTIKNQQTGNYEKEKEMNKIGKYLLCVTLLLMITACSQQPTMPAAPTSEPTHPSTLQAVKPENTPGLVTDVAPVTTPIGTGTGEIVFYSNRDEGYNDIYLLQIGDKNETRLTQSQTISFSGPFSPDGTLLLFTGFGLTNSYIGVMNADGTDPIDLTNQPSSDDGFPAWSPDGSKIIFTSNRDGNNEIYVMNTDGSQATRLTTNPTDDFAPSWSPDGKLIAFVSDRDNETGIYSIYLMNSDGSGVTRLTNEKGNDYTPVWSPNGSKIAFRSVQGGQSDIFVVNADGTGMVNVSNNPSEEWSPSWSPDGSLIAFQTDRDGNWEIYIMNADGSNPLNLTNNPADDQLPFWKK